ncbi:MAG: glycosyltransferase family 4 protein [Candidatus Omnitrophica bacterium]|nr:glycosyltransferase family 4 protein [Candidatus Omnitrophota bacterium]
MKILQVTTHINIGGIANYILSLSEALAAKGVGVVVASGGGNLEGEFRLRKIPHMRLNIKTKFEFGPKVILSAFRLANIVRRERIDIIHAHTRVSQVAGLLASLLTGVPYVTTCHGYFKVRSRKMIDTWGCRVIAISDAVRRHLKEDLGVDDGRIRLIYSGVDQYKFTRKYSDEDKADIMRELGLKDAPVVGTIGRLSQVKGQRYLVQAMPDIIAGTGGAQCLIVGDGPEKLALENLAKALSIRDSVYFAPSYVDTPKLLAIMDVFVFPSVKEGLGIALLEAMAAGKACVASDIGGISDIIEDPSYGTLVPVGDIKAIAGSVTALIGDKRLLRDMGNNARRLAAEKFSLDAMRDNVIELYKGVLDEKK